MFAKNHFGSHTRGDAKHLHMGLIVPDEYPNEGNARYGYGLYRVLVDLMGWKLIREKNLIFIMDALWSAGWELDAPSKWQNPPFNDDWSSSIFISQDPVAIESVGYDFLRTEYTAENHPDNTYPQLEGADDHLEQAADSDNWPSGIEYDPEDDGTAIPSLGVHEHWNNEIARQYSRNLGGVYGIELLKIFPGSSPYITVISPNGGEEWNVDSLYDITWTSGGTSGNVKIEYSTNNGGSWNEEIASTPDDGSYSWTIPNIPSDSCIVRVSDTDGDPTDVSNSIFTISEPYITITSPNGGEEWYVDSLYDITWTSFATSGNVKIEYSTDNGNSWNEEIASTPDNGSYSWTIPNIPSDSCLVRVSDTDGDLSDVSNSIFTILKTPNITVTSPDGGEEWYVDSLYDITWLSENTSGNVKIEYSTDNGSSWTEEIASTPDDGSYSWTIPDAPSVNCLVSVSDADGDPADESDAVFTIAVASGVPSGKLPKTYSMSVERITTDKHFELKYTLPEKASVIFSVYDVMGKVVQEVSKEEQAGFYSEKINVIGFPAGVYFVRIEANGKKFTKTDKVLLVE
jgi:hypothetical protein